RDGHHGDREKRDQNQRQDRPAPGKGPDGQSPVAREDYLHPARSKTLTAASFNSPSTVRSRVSARKVPHDWSVADHGTSGWTGYSWLASAKIRCPSTPVRNSRSATALSRFRAWRVMPTPLTFTWVPRSA